MPKYAQIVTALQERISDGTYAAGMMIPSESQLAAEFGASRPIVVRALGILEQDGWIQAQHGRGRFVRASAGRGLNAGAGRDLLVAEKAAGVRVLSVGVVAAPMRAAFVLGLPEDTPVVARRRLVSTQAGPVQLATVYVPVDVADGTDATRPQPLPVDVTAHLAQRKGIAWEYATDRISCRLPSTEEARLLEITRRDPVLTLLVTAFDTTGTARLAVDAVLPSVRAELEDSFPLT